MDDVYGFGRHPRNQRLLLWGSVAVAAAFVVYLIATGDASGWDYAALAFLVGYALYARRQLRTMSTSEVVATDEGLRYHQAPESEMVPWSRMVGARERPLLQRIELVDARGEVCFRLHYRLVFYMHLRKLVADHVDLALARPLRSRRSFSIEAFYVALPAACLFLSTETTYAALWALVFVVMALYADMKSPRAVEVTAEDLVLTLLHRTVRIPILSVETQAQSEHYEGNRLIYLTATDTRSGDTFKIRNVGTDTLVLETTIREAARCAARGEAKDLA